MFTQNLIPTFMLENRKIYSSRSCLARDCTWELLNLLDMKSTRKLDFCGMNLGKEYKHKRRTMNQAIKDKLLIKGWWCACAKPLPYQTTCGANYRNRRRTD